MELGSAEFWTRLRLDPKVLAAEVCSIDAVNLDKTLYEQPGLRAWINAAEEVEIGLEKRAKWNVTKARARALLRIKAQPDPETKKGKTVQVIEAEVELDQEVLDAEEAHFAASDKRGALRAISSALEDRKDMLVQISAKRRQENRDS